MRYIAAIDSRKIAKAEIGFGMGRYGGVGFAVNEFEGKRKKGFVAFEQSRHWIGLGPAISLSL